MQRWLSKIRAFSQIPSNSRRAILQSNTTHLQSLSFSVNDSLFRPSFVVPVKNQHKMVGLGFQSALTAPLVSSSNGVFWARLKERRIKKLNRKRPVTPTTSKVKKIKMKTYSSFKLRFRPMRDGQIRRWHAGKRHNAHLKMSKFQTEASKPDVVHPAYATVMKKLNFFA
ncbi:hypothetical protein Syun_020203 [Stephania yunnanensis]|uniref:Ribosomal protein L35 n=1 Tax=Stephania yunnanensis TaxID=152371 RepID=A0AAP0IDH6_9MAGN